MVQKRMYPPGRDPRRLLPLRPSAFAVLAALAEAPRPGIDILEAVQATVPGITVLGPGTLYRVMRELRHEGLIRRAADQPAKGVDDRQISHELTADGRRVMEAEARRLEETLALARRRSRRTST
jgi:DNA-binding PadR family transcriptional regulator